MARSTRHRLLAGLALAFAASGARAIDSEVHGAVVDVGVGTSIAGDAVLGDLGGAWSGLRSLANERWLLDWDLSLTFRAGYAANAIPGIFLLGGRMVACSELGYRTAPAGPWSPYVGLRIGGELSLVGHPGLPLSQLSTYNDLYGLAGVNAAGSIGLGVGASLLDEVRSLRLELILQETLRAAGTYTPAYAFSEAGVGARYDTERSITLALEGLVGLAPPRRIPALGYTDQAWHWRVQAWFRDIFDNGMWLGVLASVDRIQDEVSYASGAWFSTGNAPTLSLTVSFGVPLFGEKP